ncbi:RluA family pseudouridine synthase [Pararhodospirillum oryzae]|uniref:Pseudouridine synthase n=1 Tax=Pararhodospirillum oryzae TaxID=478448 RepID=A0A512H781_9PROT|nr:RluA family pseudouridine synthase [Pararhodospirillum oryzae]GEO81240.1 pseudouridine synthase [Pararhodospirillum oryzae]
MPDPSFRAPSAPASLAPSVPEEGGLARHERLVGPDEAGLRLDKWLAGVGTGLSRARLQALIAEGRVSLDGDIIKDGSRRVKPGQRALVEEPAPLPAIPQPQAMALAVVFEDDDLIVLDKPPGLVVHPAPGNPDQTLVNALLAHCGSSLSGIGGVCRPGIVHRLDKDTSGLMVAAKTDLAHQGLAAQFAVHSLTRAYQALVWGVPRPAQGKVEGNIGRHPTLRQRMAVVKAGGKTALTHYRVLEAWGTDLALVECRLATGRTHQVRVHMASLGHPLVGDPVYGRRTVPRSLPLPLATALGAFPRQALHAVRLGFVHPRSGESLLFESALPDDLAALVRLARGA